MQIEEGKYYRTRDGRKVGPMTRSNRPFYSWADKTKHMTFTDDGFFNHHDTQSPNDLIEEWTDDPPVVNNKEEPKLSGTTIDAIAIDSLKFHFSTELETLEREAFRIVLRYYGVSV